MTAKTENGKNVALVLSGGGARGMAHIGVIEEIRSSGFNITSISGTSIGALIGGVFVSGKMDEFKEWVTHMSKLDVFKFMDFAISKNGFIKGEKVFNALKQFIVDESIENLKIPYAAVAVDLKNHKEVIFRSGPLKEAIRASVSVPTILKPAYYNGVELVDGGVLNPLPIDCIIRKPGDLLIAVDLNADIPYTGRESGKVLTEQENNYRKAMEFINEKWSAFFKNGRHKRAGFFDLITESVYAMQMKLTRMTIKEHNPDLVVNISRKSCDLFEYHRSDELINYGRQQFKKCLAEYRQTKNL